MARLIVNKKFPAHLVLITPVEISFKFHVFNVTVRRRLMNCETSLNLFICLPLQRPPSSSLSYGGAMNDDVRSPGSGSTPGPLSAQPPPGLGDPDPGKSTFFILFHFYCVNQSIELKSRSDMTVMHVAMHFMVRDDSQMKFND